MLNRLERHKKVKANGVTFIIRRLSPELFMSEECFPLNNLLSPKQETEKKIKEIETNQDEIKKTIQTMLLKGVVCVKHWFNEKSMDSLIENIMSNTELYSYLFTEILQHSFGIKKKIKSMFHLTGNLQPLLTV